MEGRVRKLVEEWKLAARKRTIDCDKHAKKQLVDFPDPMSVCSVFTTMMLNGDCAGSTRQKNTYNRDDYPHLSDRQFALLSIDIEEGLTPGDFCGILFEINDVRFLDDYVRLYRAFEAKAEWRHWSICRLAPAILRTNGGWERIRREFSQEERWRLIISALLSCHRHEADVFRGRLSEEERKQAIPLLLQTAKELFSEYSDDTRNFRICGALTLIGEAAIETLLNIYRSDAPKPAASAICSIPGALDLLATRLTTQEIEDIIVRRWEYAGTDWDENFMRFIKRLNTPRCIEILNEWLDKVNKWGASDGKARQSTLLQSLLDSQTDQEHITRAALSTGGRAKTKFLSVDYEETKSKATVATGALGVQSSVEYMEVNRNLDEDGNAKCSDNRCTCGYPGVTLKYGEGYMYVSQEVTAFRKDCPTTDQAVRKAKEMQARGEQLRAEQLLPVLVCELGARARSLDLAVAAADARHWWKTGMVPIRPTPLAPRKRQHQPISPMWKLAFHQG